MRLPVISGHGGPAAVPPRPAGFAAPVPPAVVDGHGRRCTYVRLSVTDRCDLRCRYCMPSRGVSDHASRAEMLTFEEIVRLARVLEMVGVRRLRFTGGEPLVRKHLVRLIEQVRSGSELRLDLTTNGTLLAPLAARLAEAGLAGANVSLDSLRPERFAAITRGGDLARVLAGIRAAIDAGIEVKLNTVPLEGVNDDELADIVRFAWRVGAVPRFVELMPIGEASRYGGHRIPAGAVLDRLEGLVTDEPVDIGADRGPARYVRAADGSGRRVGVIGAVSEPFCETCNRLRITARGEVRACVASRRSVSLRDVLRESGDPLDVAWALHWAAGSKVAGHRFDDAEAQEHAGVAMSGIGG